jgi:hypothetical protein
MLTGANFKRAKNGRRTTAARNGEPQNVSSGEAAHCPGAEKTLGEVEENTKIVVSWLVF